MAISQQSHDVGQCALTVPFVSDDRDQFLSKVDSLIIEPPTVPTIVSDNLTDADRRYVAALVVPHSRLNCGLLTNEDATSRFKEYLLETFERWVSFDPRGLFDDCSVFNHHFPNKIFEILERMSVRAGNYRLGFNRSQIGRASCPQKISRVGRIAKESVAKFVQFVAYERFPLSPTCSPNAVIVCRSDYEEVIG